MQMKIILSSDESVEEANECDVKNMETIQNAN